jgi:hypothetical protein
MSMFTVELSQGVSPPKTKVVEVEEGEIVKSGAAMPPAATCSAKEAVVLHRERRSSSSKSG